MEVDLRDRSIRCIVKLANGVIGGAAITCKNELEKIHDENLETVACQLREAMMEGSAPNKIIGMDWSKKAGSSHICCNVDESEDHQSCHFSPFVVVHGAGSFGHFQASRSGVHRGGLDKPIVKAGFVATRISVTNLNLQIVRALAQEGLPTIGMSPFPSGWSTSNRDVASADLSTLAKTIHSGFVPVLHGDAVLDDILGCTILSGDVVIRHLAHHLKPEYVVFLTDVLGVYDRPPSEPDAVLLKEIAVEEDGSWKVVNPVLDHTNKRVETSVAAHDTTGGMETKIAEAAMIAKLGIDVYIVKAATAYSQRALSGDLRYNVPEDWLGTIIRMSQKKSL